LSGVRSGYGDRSGDAGPGGVQPVGLESCEVPPARRTKIGTSCRLSVTSFKSCWLRSNQKQNGCPEVELDIVIQVHISQYLMRLANEPRRRTGSSNRGI